MTIKARMQSRLKRSKRYVFTAGVVIETRERLKVDYRLVGASDAYNSGKTTQIPASMQIKTSPRFKRTLSVGSSKLNG